MFAEPEFWVAVAFFILMGVFAYLGVHRTVLTTLDHRRDRIQLVAYAQLALSAVEAAGAHDAGESGQKSAHSIGEDQYKRYGYTG